MPSHFSEATLPVDIQWQVDAICQEFEQAWNKGVTPKLEDYLAQATPFWRSPLLRELLILELSYRRDDSGGALSDAQLCSLHPVLMPEIADQLKLLHDRKRGLSQDGGVTLRLPTSTREFEPTIAHEPSSSSGSRGLHIRCPHCSNPVELLTDTPLESITCRSCGSAFSLVDNEDQTRAAPTLKRIGRFDLVSRLGLGGFGTVWKARDTELDRTVAVKIPRKGQLAREEVEQFLREARSAAQLRHPNIVPVHEIGRDGDTLFIVSDLIRGVSLSDWLSGAKPHPRETARLMATVADALQHAHEKGVIHRDLKPSNVLMDDFGQPHVMDFGLAKREVGEVTMTVEGQVLGTPAYMSPEQAGGRGHWTDRRTDIYSMGVILFRMLTGELPFRGNAQMQIHSRLTEDPPDPRKLNRHLPRDLCTICLKCLERDPNRRFPTAKELAQELRRFDRNEPILSRPISRTERVVRWAHRHPAPTVAALLTVFLAVAGPFAAFLIATQRNRLAEEVAENQNLIEQYAANKQSDANTIVELRDQLDVWEGRANPWKIWPPKPAENPRRLLLVQVAALGDRLSAAWQSADDEQRAYGLLALAVMNDELDRDDLAAIKYQEARNLLAKLAAKNPGTTQYSVALADCYRQLSRLNVDKNRSEAAKELEQARLISQHLASQHNDPRIEAGWLETELESGTMNGANTNLQNLTRAEQISAAFPAKVPQDPIALYDLACFLGGREPILKTRQPVGEGKSDRPVP